MKTLALVLLLSLSVSAQEAPKEEAAKAAEKVDTASPPAKVPPEIKEDAKPAAEPPKAPEREKAAPPPEEAAPKAKADESPAKGGPEGEFDYLKWAADQDDSATREATIEDLEGFIHRHREDDLGQQAQLLLPQVVDKKGDHYEAVLDILMFLYEYPESKLAFSAKRQYLDLVDKRMGRKIREGLNLMADVPKASSKEERLAAALHGVVDKAGDYFREPLEEEFVHFETRFPDYPKRDSVLMDWGSMRAKNSKWTAALLPYRKLLAMYPKSDLRSQAQWEIGNLYADHIKDYDKAVDAFQELVEKYPKDGKVEAALERTAQLFEDKLKRYDLAHDVDEKIVKLFPNTIGALHALQDEAHLERDKMDKSMDAINTCKRLAQMFHNSSGIEALELAAKIARKDIKNYTLEIELHRQIAKDFPDYEQAPDELYAAAMVYEDDLGDLDSASKAYAEVASKFPTHRLAAKAQSHIEKIEKKKQKG